MKLIKESPEHHFLTFLEKIKKDAGGWVGIRFLMSRKTKHFDIINRPEKIKEGFAKRIKESEALLGEVGQQLEKYSQATAYLFPDSDIIVMVRIQNEAEHKELHKIYKGFAEKVGPKLCEFSNLAKDIYNYQKVADERFLAAQRVKAYEHMADLNRVQSIPVRRKRREDDVILMVEDDRFTATYAANILSNDFEVVLAKTGEEAILEFIEHAPSMVFLDIHLPGLDGIDTLRALKTIDPEAFIVMLSVDTVKQNIVAATQFGAAGFLKKPFSKERLINAVGKSPFIKGVKKSSPQK